MEKIIEKCSSCRYYCGDMNKCSYCDLEKDYSSLKWVCKNYVFSEEQIKPKLEKDKEFVTKRLGELAKELLNKESKDKELIKLQYNALEMYLTAIELRLKTI